MEKAPARRRLPSSGPELGDVGSSSGSREGVVNVRSAARSALSTIPTDAAFDFCKETPGDAGFDARWGVDGDRDTKGDRLLVACQVRDHRVKCALAEALPELGEVASLIGSRSLEAGDEVPAKPQIGIILLLDVFDCGPDLHDALGPQSAASRGMTT
jgi:hypothetical protein